ncbi:MAG TPA: tetratricopeptide repeat protein [Candidatus Sulfopaludibacter sp.]|nr:tetratricopeptide repeat protein [Candidatus Sulfopaludibacter sp.]
MNWLRAATLLAGVLPAYGAAGHYAGTGAGPHGNAEEIASAREALRQATAAYGEDHPVTAFMLNNLALAMREGGYFNYAGQYAGQALAILERRFGPNDVSLAPPLNVLAEAAVSECRYGEARAFAMRAVAIGPDAGAHYGTALHDLAAVYHAEGNYGKAAEYYREALAAWEKVLPAGHPFFRITRMALDQVRRPAKLSAHRQEASRGRFSPENGR